ncbi:hypothetical protein FOCC_FOCC010745, partial [Frankliniella occidentalis]
VHCTPTISQSTKLYLLIILGRGKCGVAVIRVSGPRSGVVLSALAGDTSLLKPRMAQLRTLRNPQSKEILDKAIVIWFPGSLTAIYSNLLESIIALLNVRPKSFTGEDTCEFQVHGGLAVISGLLETIGNIPGIFPADPGEFSKKAFFNGSIDLTEAEGLADLIHAETEMQRRQAIYQMSGSLHTLYDGWRNTLLQSLAHVEAYIDFSEDENIEDGIMHDVKDSITKLAQEVQGHLADGQRGQRLRDGVQATIVGEPNVGKSSDKPAAIVTAIAGTTRDVVEQYINIGGYPLLLADTAGIRGDCSAVDAVEKEGIARAKQFAKVADVILLVIDTMQFLNCLDSQEITEEFICRYIQEHLMHLGLLNVNKSRQILKRLQQPSTETVENGPFYIIIFNKVDLVVEQHAKRSINNLQSQYQNVVALSSLTKEGLSQLLFRMEQMLEILCGNPCQESPALSQVRHRLHLTDCVDYLHDYLHKTVKISASEINSLKEDSHGIDLAICAEDLRKAAYHLGRITGHVTTEQILDVIFRDFCIGK